MIIFFSIQHPLSINPAQNSLGNLRKSGQKCSTDLPQSKISNCRADTHRDYRNGVPLSTNTVHIRLLIRSYRKCERHWYFGYQKVSKMSATRKEPAGAGGATGASHQLRRATNQTTRRGGAPQSPLEESATTSARWVRNAQLPLPKPVQVPVFEQLFF